MHVNFARHKNFLRGHNFGTLSHNSLYVFVAPNTNENHDFEDGIIAFCRWYDIIQKNLMP